MFVLRRWYSLMLCVIVTLMYFGFFSVVLADTTSTNVSVGAIVNAGVTCGNGIIESGESCDNGVSNGASCPATCSFACIIRSCGGGGGGGDIVAPSISNIVEVVSTTSLHVSWNATDNVSVSSCSFVYGLTEEYGVSGVVVGAYSVALSNLVAETEYFYKISCIDSSNNTANEVGSFVTASKSAFVLVSVVSTSTSQTMAKITWDASSQTSKNITGCTLGYGLNNYALSGVVSGSYQSVIMGLLPNTAYQCRITCIDDDGIIGNAECPFVTLSDVTPPPDVSSFVATGTTTANILSWQYSQSISDFDHFHIEWSLGGCPARGTGTALPIITDITQSITQHTGLSGGTTYYYRLSVVDTSGNTSAGVCASAIPSNAVETPVCGNNILEGGEQCDGSAMNGATCVSRGFDGGVLGCSAQCAFNTAACLVAPATCGNGVVNVGETCDDGNNNPNDSCTNVCQSAVCGDGVIRSGSEQCDGSDLGGQSCVSQGYSGGSLFCSNACSFVFSGCGGDSFVEQCTNMIDDDLDGFVDCNDSDCSTHPACISSTVCSDGADNDGDGFVDLSDPGCTSLSDTDEYNAPEITVPDDERISTVLYWIAERTIAVSPINGVVKSLTGDQLTVGIAESELYQVTPSTTLTLVLQGKRYAFVRSEDAVYRADVVFPSVGVYDVTIEIFYTDDLFDSVTFRIESAPYGIIISAKDSERVSGAQVFLYQNNSVFDLSPFRQKNPVLTDSSGTFGFVVPNGTYVLVVNASGYNERKTYSFTVTDHVINRSLELVLLPETPLEVVTFAIESATQEIKDLLEKTDDPVVEQVTERVVAPVFVGTSFAAIVPSLFSILIPLLRFLFLQPLYLVGKRKRQAWGVVYNSLNKLPIDLATIRLIDAKTKRVVQSRVTDAKGRYLFMAEMGTYVIEVFKQGFVFPTHLFFSVREDGSYLDIYHGEEVTVTEKDTQITPNIPVDPIDTKEKTVKRIIIEKWLRRLQHSIAVISIVGACMSVYITPSFVTFVFLCVHIVLFVLFIRYVSPKKPKGWGLVYEHETKQPIGRAVARLFSRQFNKLVSTQITDSKGRYSFLVGPNDYYVTFEKEGYAPEKTDSVVVKEGSGLVVKDVSLKKGDTASVVPPETSS